MAVNDGLMYRFVSHEMKSSLIRVHSYEEKSIAGTIENPFFPHKQKQQFENMTQLLLMIDSILDMTDIPSHSVESRPSTKGEEPAPPSPETEDMASLAVFRVSVLFRQNSSWQGEIFWVDCSLSSSFRSVLEFIGLLDSALESEA